MLAIPIRDSLKVNVAILSLKVRENIRHHFIKIMSKFTSETHIKAEGFTMSKKQNK